MDNAYKDRVASALAQGLLDFVNHSTSVQPANPIPSGDPNQEADN